MEPDTHIDCLRCLVVSFGPDAAKITNSIAKLLEMYIWEQDGLLLQNHREIPCPWQPSMPDDTEAEWLWSEIHHCGSMEDEWFLAFLLSYITDVFKGQVMAQVFTNDGQFMLTEAANLLPSWVDCAKHGSIDEIARDRVWIYKGLLHVIPLQGAGNVDFSPKALTMSRAVRAVCCSRNNTLAPARIQEHLFKHHLSRFPSAIVSASHKAKIWLPRAAAAALIRHKDLGASAARAFLDRTAHEMRASLNKGQFWPEANKKEEAMATCVITLRKSHYASLVSSPFSAPKLWPRPLGESSAVRKQADLGVKLTIGLNILLHRSRLFATSEGLQKCTSEQAQLDELPEWRRYIKALQNQGFFGKEVEGSAVHKRRCKDAEAAFRGSQVFADMQKRAEGLCSDLQAVLDLPATDLTKACNAERVEDGDEWMFNEFNHRMDVYTKTQSSGMTSDAACHPSASQDATGQDSAELSALDVMNRLSRFFESESSSAGARPDPSSFSLNAEKLLHVLRGNDQTQPSLPDSDEGSVGSSGTDDEDVGDQHPGPLNDASDGKRDEGEKSFMKAYMDQMESEMGEKSGRDSQVNIDMDSVTNLLKSVTEGSDMQPGAAHGLFGMLGLSVPKSMNIHSSTTS